jgi:N-acetylmuramoyl-L-alanine amidase
MRATGYVSVAGLIAASAAFSCQDRVPAEPEQPVPAASVPAQVVMASEPEAVALPAVPVRVALQAGHWKALEAPDELAGLRDNGTSHNGTPEWKVNLGIAERTAAVLREKGYEVDILPATVPPSYKADLFISIHADGNNNSAVSGYRVAAPSPSTRRGRRGPVMAVSASAEEIALRTERSLAFADLLEKTYGDATGIPLVPTVTRRMQNYYAFNFRRYRHALDPTTVGVILETGFLTSPRDREIIVSDPDRSVRGIVAAVTQFRPVQPVVPSLQIVAAPPPPPTPGR